MAGALTLRPELDRLRCSEPGCHNHRLPILIEPTCHEVSVFVEYHGGGEVVLVCGECMQPFMTLQVAG